jgi:hypothetical protein
VEGHVTSLKDVEKRKILEAGEQQPKEMQLNRMEINMATLGAIDAKRRTTILNRVTLLYRGIHILNLNIFMWIKKKQNYDKHVERL